MNDQRDTLVGVLPKCTGPHPFPVTELSLEVDDEGEYSVVVTNGYGNSSDRGYINVRRAILTLAELEQFYAGIGSEISRRKQEEV